MAEDRYYTPHEVAKILKVTYMTVYRWLKSGKLPYFKAGKQYRISKVELDKFMNEQK